MKVGKDEEKKKCVSVKEQINRISFHHNSHIICMSLFHIE